ncbi:hypothetical protein IPH92_02110 [Candidatus Kaiserbacteria bacterium]|nr:MAG: hypothetical protein IPH92_02110 [Candidatus Kaiserbacteria bacterium]
MVRTHPYTKEKSIYTEEQANVFDGDLKNYKHFRYFLESMKQFLDVNDISLLELYREHQSILRARNTNEPLCKEVVMNISNYLIAIYPNVGVSIHFQHAIFLFESGERYHHIQRNGFMLQLQEFKRRGYQKVHITTHQEKSCAKCVALDKKVLTIDQAMTKQLLPCTKCTFAFKKEGPAGWCRCSYTAV